MARYDSTGAVQWARASSGLGQSKSSRRISVADGRLFITGQVGFSAATFDGVALTPGSSGTHLYVLATDLDGNPVSFDADDILAICVQHEIDHLDGKLFIDRISRLKRIMFENKLKKGTRQSQVK